MRSGDLENAGKEIIPWKKGEEVKSQALVYARLPKGYVVKFYQEGMEGTKGFRITIAMDAMPRPEYCDRYDEITQRVLEGAKGRRVCTFNL